MTRSLILAAALAAPVPALALTPQELWEGWQGMAAAFGATLSATATAQADGALRLSGFVGGPEGSTVPLSPAAPVQEVVLRPNGDGTVTIDLGRPLEDLLAAAGGADARVLAVGPTLTARDGAAGPVCEVGATRFGATSLAPPDDVPGGEVSMEALTPILSLPCGVPSDGRWAVGLGVAGLAYATASAPDAVLPSSQASRLEGPLSLEVGATLPPLDLLMAMDTPMGFVEALDAGLAFDARFDNGAVEQADWSEGLLAFESTMSTGPGRFEMSLDRAGLAMAGAYAGGGRGTFASPELPVGVVDYAYGALDVDLRVPLTSEPGELRYRVAVEGVTVGEPLWALVDPDGALPRDPARLIVDLGGTVAVDLPATVATMEGMDAMGMGVAPEPPVPDIRSLEVRELDVALAGVTLGGEGSFTFETLDGLPSPIGTATLRLDGLDRILDKAVELGWARPEDVRDARLGLATMFRAGDGPDSRVAVVEARAGGQVLVNGVQVR